jgi:excisionase family DNA binding protein
MKAVLTITEAAYYLASTEDALRKLIEADRIPYRRQGKCVLFVQRDLDKWLNRLRGVSVNLAIRTLSGRDTAVDTAATPSVNPTPSEATQGRSIALVRGPQRPRFPPPSEAAGRAHG